jgi:hypothetical protein
MKTKMELKHGQIISRKRAARSQREWDRQHPALIWTLWYENSAGEDTFVASFPSRAEARQHVTEGLGHLRRAGWRYSIEGHDAYSGKSEYCEWPF